MDKLSQGYVEIFSSSDNFSISFGNLKSVSISAFVLLLSVLLLSSCGDATLQTEKHTYSQLGYTVSYDYPEGYYAVSSDDEPPILIYADGNDDKSDWSVLIRVSDMNSSEFEEYKGNAAKTASDITQNDDVWTFVYKEPSEQTVMMKWFESGELLVLHKANDFDMNDAFGIANSFEIKLND